MLKKSVRKWSFMRSLMAVDFTTETSAMLIRGPITVLRPALPNVPLGAATKAVVLNQASHRLGPVFGFPTRLGRSLLDSPLPLGAAPFQKGVIGRPLPMV